MEKFDEQDSLLAVIIAYTYDDKFFPATQDCPMAVLSLVNNPLIFYSFEWLRRNKVVETIIYCNQKDAETIKSQSEIWSSGYVNRMELTVVSSDSCSSLGDAMRDLHSKSLLKRDFILLDGFIVGNSNLRKAVQTHRESLQEDPTCIMTCLYRRRIGHQGFKPRCMDNVRITSLLVNDSTSRILNHYRPTKPEKIVRPSLTRFMLAASQNTSIWSLEDPYVSICSERVPMLYSEHPDWGTRDTLIQEVNDQYISRYSVRALVAKKGHMQIVSSLRAYEELSKLLVKRWFSPLVPERNLLNLCIRYNYDDEHNNYYDESVKFDRCAIGDYNVIGEGTKIDMRCRMNNSVVGKNCIIKGVTIIKDSFLMDNVTIGNGCIIENSFIGNNVKLFPCVYLDPGVILGPNIILGPRVRIDRYKKLVKNPSEDESFKVKSFKCGEAGEAHEVIEDNVEVDLEELLRGFQDLKWGKFPPNLSLPKEEFDDSVKINEEELEPALDLDFSSDEEREHEFENKVMDSLSSAYKDKIKLESVLSDLSSSRDACNVSWENALRVIVKVVLHVVEELEDESGLTGDKLWQCVKKGLKYFEELLGTYIKTLTHQIIILNLLESIVNEEERYLEVIQHIFYHFNQYMEIIDQEVLLFWYRKGGHKTPKFSLIDEKINKFVKWLEDPLEVEGEAAVSAAVSSAASAAAASASSAASASN